jgi:hypothetical protein
MSAEIKMRWGSSSWTPKYQRRCRTHLRHALELVSEGAEDLGVRWEEPKTAVLHRVHSEFDLFGLATSARQFQLYIPHNTLKRNGLEARCMHALALASFHEVTHTARKEAVPDDNSFLEEVAGEGLAYVAESLFADLILLPGENEYEPEIPDWSVALQRELLEQVALEPNDDAAHERWLGDDTAAATRYPAAGITLGMHAVRRQLDAGQTLSELIPMPAPQLLGLDGA